MANKRKILETARKYVQKGAKEKALKEYEKLLKLDPKDARLRIEIGDAYRRWGQTEDAIATYTKVAQHYMAEGFDARAVAVYKQIQNLDPEHWASYEPLSDLYQRMGLTSEAINTLRVAADGMHKAGDKRQALELLRKMATIDPSHTASRLKVADLLRQEGMNDEAIAEYDGVVDELVRQGEAEQAGNVLEKILEIDPQRVPALVRLVENLVERRIPQQAEPFAKRAVDAEPDVPEHYERLAEVYRVQRRDDALPEVYRRMADVYRQRGDEDKARDILQRFVPSDGIAADTPTSPDLGAEQLLEDEVAGQGGVSEFLADDEFGPDTLLEEEFIAGEEDPVSRPDPNDLAEQTVLDSAPPTRSEPIPPAAELEELELEVDDPGPELEPEREPLLEPDPPPAAAAPQPTGEPDQLFAEACVYLRYGKRNQAMVNLEAILAQEPEHRGALEKLGEAHAESNDAPRAVELWLRAARCADADGDVAGLDILRDRIAALDPQAAAKLPAAGEPEPEPTVAEPEPEPMVEELAAEPESMDLDDIEIDVDDSELDEVAGDLDDEPLAEPAAEPVAAQSASVSASQQVSEEIEEADFYMQQGLHDEAEAVYRRVLEVAPNHPQALVRLGEIAAARGDDPSTTADGVASAADAPEPHPEVPDVAAAEPAPVDAAEDEWTDGLPDSEEIEVEIPDLDEIAAAPDLPVDQDAETDLDLDDPADMDETPASVEAAEPAPPPPAPAPEPQPVAVAAPPEPAARPDPDLDLALPQAPASKSPDDSFDLAAELSDALDDDATGTTISGLSSGEDDLFAAVFSEFKKGVADALSESDHEAHYDLGIAYREMGLLDDAMAEFRTSMASESRRLDSLQMLGLCSLEQGAAEEAVGHFEMALSTEDINDEQQLAMRFELGRAFEAMGDVEAARSSWEAVAAQDPGFCDVEERLAGLADPKPDPEPDGPGGDPDTAETEAFESFDDFFSEDDGGGDPEPVDAPADDPPDDAMAISSEDFSDLIEEANSSTDPGLDDTDAPSLDLADAAEEVVDVSDPDDADVSGLDLDLAPDADLAPAPEPVAEAALPEPEPEIAAEPEPEPETEDATEETAAAEAPKRRRKKKISFV